MIYSKKNLNDSEVKKLVGCEVYACDQLHETPVVGTLTGIKDGNCPFQVEMEDDCSYFYKYIRPGRTEATNKKTIMPKGGNNMAMSMDIGQIISMKVMTSLIDSDKELDLGKLALVQSLSNGGQFQITDVVKAKILSKLSINDKTNAEDLPIEKLVILKMLEEGNFDVMEIIKARLIAKELKD